jgi:glycosyltransferase involved in cell wall biosynthesis
MLKLGVVVDGHRGFIEELLDDWQARYETAEFLFEEIELRLSKGRLNRWRLRRSLKQFMDEKDLVFFEWAGPMTIVGTLLPVRTPVIVRLHSWELYEFAPHICWDAVDRVILVSRAMQQRFTELFPDQKEKTRVVYCGKSLTEFELTPRQFNGRIGLLGDIVPIKRVYEMVFVLHELRQKGYDLTLHIGGKPRDGSNNQRYSVSLRRAIEKLSLRDHVTFYGWVDDVASWLYNIDVFVSNSYWEGQQNALLEAMATGCYCLSHFWDGAEEILPADYLFAGDTELQEKILQYVAISDEQKALHPARLRAIVEEKFDVEQMKQSIHSIVAELA